MTTEERVRKVFEGCDPDPLVNIVSRMVDAHPEIGQQLLHDLEIVAGILTEKEEKMLLSALRYAWEECADDVVRYDKTKSQKRQREIMEDVAFDRLHLQKERGIASRMLIEKFFALDRKAQQKIVKKVVLSW